jgi:hypothetical protein
MSQHCQVPSAAARPYRGRVALARALVALVLLAGSALGPRSARGETPETCRIGVNIEDLYDLDMARDTFGAVLWIWSLCPSGTFAPLDTVAFPTTSTGLSLGPLRSIDVGSAGQYQYRRVQGTFRQDWDVSRYPFDRQHIAIPIDETHYGSSLLVFEPDVSASFLTPDVRAGLSEWRISDLELTASVSEEASTYGLPNAHGASYARIEAGLTMRRAQLSTFLKLTTGVFVGMFIAFLSFSCDPTDREGFGHKLGLLVAVLFAILINMQTTDATIGDAGRVTLVTNVHLVSLVTVVLLALLAARDRRRAERGLPVRYPDWPTLAVVGGLYVLVTAGLVGYAAWA